MKNPLLDPLGTISGLFRKDGPIVEPKPKKKLKQSPKSSEPPNGPEFVDVLAEVEGALTKIAQAGSTAIAGRVQVLRFDELRQELGDKWEEMGDRIETVIDNCIGQQLSPTDMRWRLGPHAFVLVFTSVTPAEAEVKCGLIRAQVEEYFKGTPGLSGKIAVETAVSSVDGTISLEPIADLKTLYERLKLSTTSEGSEKVSNDLAGRITSDTKGEDERRQEDVNWKSTDDDFDAATLRVKSIELFERNVWDVSGQKILGLAVAPQSSEGGGVGRSGSILTEWSGGAMTCALDAVTLEHVAQLQSSSTLPEAHTVWFQTHFGSYGNQKFREVLIRHFSRLDDEAPNLITMEIIGLPNRREQLQNVDQINFATSYVSAVALCLDLFSPQTELLRQNVPQWVGFTIPDKDLEEDTILDAISKFVSIAKKHGVNTYARNLPTENLVAAAIGLGVQCLHSNQIGSLNDQTADVFDVGNFHPADR